MQKNKYTMEENTYSDFWSVEDTKETVEDTKETVEDTESYSAAEDIWADTDSFADDDFIEAIDNDFIEIAESDLGEVAPEITGSHEASVITKTSKKMHKDLERKVGGDLEYKDQVTLKLVPEVVSECSLVHKKSNGIITGTCLSQKAVTWLGSKAGMNIAVPDEQVLKEIKQRYSASSDKDLLQYLPDDLMKEQSINFKISGPDGVQLLSNYDIDQILTQWTVAFPDFWAYNFNMLNYTQQSFRDGRVQNQPDTLATVDPVELFKKYKCCGCVINSDVYSGSGKHWMALFADNRGPEPTVEFFNSSGRSPAPEWISWLNRTARAIDEVNKAANTKKAPAKIRYGNMVQQYSMTECGLYSLFYIWGRLNGIGPDYFMTKPIKDELMFEFRAHLYEGYLERNQKHWSYEVFKKNTKVKWDSSGGHREGEK